MKLKQLAVPLRRIAVLTSFLLVLFACREPFEPENPQSASSVLVVEGYIDTQGLESELIISRTVPLDLATTLSPETGASVTLFADNGTAYTLSEGEAGSYMIAQDLPENSDYRLEIVLRGGERFESTSISPIVTPEILDAGFVRDEEGVEVFVNTKGNETADDFLWTFEETWVTRPRIRTGFIYDPSIENVRLRNASEQISLCFKTEGNPDILLETSSRFQDQVVFRQTITEIPTGDERLQDRYSILISQKAIDAEAVQFWETLKRNTEDIGSIFSPLPSQISGNIRSVDNSGISAIGQISMGVTMQRRIFIDLLEVAPWGFSDPEFDDCFVEEEPVMEEDYKTVFASGFTVPVRELMAGTAIIGYYPSSRRCVDCTLYGSPVVPDFWEED
jgi:hypothetical protein